MVQLDWDGFLALMRSRKSSAHIPKPHFPTDYHAHPIGCHIMPGLAFDKDGGRIGYGAGYYDRYLHDYRQRLPGNSAFLIGVCHEEQLFDCSLPVERHDLPLDVIVTPLRVIRVSKKIG